MRPEPERGHGQDAAPRTDVEHPLPAAHVLLEPLDDQLRGRVVPGAEGALRVEDQLDAVEGGVGLVPALADADAAAQPDRLERRRPHGVPVPVRHRLHLQGAGVDAERFEHPLEPGPRRAVPRLGRPEEVHHPVLPLPGPQFLTPVDQRQDLPRVHVGAQPNLNVVLGHEGRIPATAPRPNTILDIHVL